MRNFSRETFEKRKGLKKCNNTGLNKVIIDKRDLDFSLKLTNAIVIELYYYMIKNNYTWKLLRDIL